MKYCMIALICGFLWFQSISAAGIRVKEDGEANLHFGFETENGQYRSENIKYNMESSSAEQHIDGTKPVEYRGGYSFVSADGYEYTVLYKANKNGFQPYVTAKKLLSVVR